MAEEEEEENEAARENNNKKINHTNHASVLQNYKLKITLFTTQVGAIWDDNKKNTDTKQKWSWYAAISRANIAISTSQFTQAASNCNWFKLTPSYSGFRSHSWLGLLILLFMKLLRCLNQTKSLSMLTFCISD